MTTLATYLDRLDLSDGTVAALPPPLARGILALSPDETMMAYLSSQTLVVRDLATAYDASQDSLKWQIPLDVTWPTQVSELVWSPDGQRILVTADHRIEGCDIAGHSSWELDISTGILTATSTFVPPAEPTPIPCSTPEARGDITRETFLIFCGGRDHVNIPHNAPLILGDALTVEAYVNHFGNGGEEPNVLIESFVTFSLSFAQNQVSFCLLPGIDKGDGYGEWVCLSHPQPEPGQWFHLAGSWDGENIYLFYDGKLQAKAAFTGPLFHGPADLILNIGNDWITSAHEDKGFKGYIDELRLSSIGRYNADFEPQNQVTADEFTVGLWHFDEGQGTTTTDESRLENHGILSPFVRWGSQP